MRNDSGSASAIAVELAGRTYTGHYTTANGMVTVSTRLARRSTHLGGMVAEALARSVLYELVREGKA